MDGSPISVSYIFRRQYCSIYIKSKIGKNKTVPFRDKYLYGKDKKNSKELVNIWLTVGIITEDREI